jgi:ketosteroid isomerase-like protein
MAEEERTGLGEKVSEAVERAKDAVGLGEGEHAGKAEGRVRVVREALRSFGEGEHDRFFEAFHEEVEWVAPAGKKFPGAGTHSGRDEIREEFTEDIGRGFPEFGFRPDHYLEAGLEEWVVTLGAFIGEGSGGSFDVPGAVVWEFDGDKISRVRIYADSEAFPKPVEEEETEPEKREGGDGERAQGGDGDGKPEGRGADGGEDSDDGKSERGDETAGATSASSEQDSGDAERRQSGDG